MNANRIATIAIIGMYGLTLGACGGGEDAPAGQMEGDVPAADQAGHMEGMRGMEGMGEMMARHAEEADSMVAVMRDHIRQMRALSPEQWHERMGEHATRVSGMLGMLNRQEREMDMVMGMSDEQMGEMMGMSGEEHREMMDEMQALRTDLEQLQTASPDQVRERMGAHLDRLERMVEMMEESAGHMRSM